MIEGFYHTLVDIRLFVKDRNIFFYINITTRRNISYYLCICQNGDFIISYFPAFYDTGVKSGGPNTAKSKFPADFAGAYLYIKSIRFPILLQLFLYPRNGFFFGLCLCGLRACKCEQANG